MECILENDDGTKAVVMCGHEKKTFKSSEIGQVNPPKFEQCILENDDGTKAV